MKGQWRVVVGAALLAAVAGCATEDARFASLGADSLDAGDYRTAERHLKSALDANPNNEYALLNLGVVYQDTGRPELARQTYAEILRLNRAERAVRVVARPGTGADPDTLARANLADLNLTPSETAGADAIGHAGDVHPIGTASFGALHGQISGMYQGLEALAENIQAMSETLRIAAEASEQAAMPARTQQDVARAPSEPDHAMPADPREEAASPRVRPVTAPAPAPTPAPTPAKTRVPKDDAPIALVEIGTRMDEQSDTAPLRRASTRTRAENRAFEPDPPTRAAPRESVVGSTGGVRVHIASFRTEAAAERGWSVLRETNDDLLGRLGLELRRIDFGPGMGVFYRVQAGPLTSERAAQSLCAALKSRGLYCALAYF